MSRNTKGWLSAAGIVLAALPAFSQTTNLSEHDQRIIALIYRASFYERAEATLAKERSNSAPIKDFAEQILTDQQSADEQLRSYASRQGIDLDALREQIPTWREERLERERRAKTVGSATGEWAYSWENTLPAKDEREQVLAALGKLDGAAFDREFLRVTVDTHERLLDRLTAAGDLAISPDLHELIEGMLPTVRRHLQAAQALRDANEKA